MDTTTILEIIKMIDVSILNLEDDLHDDDTNAHPEYLEGGIYQLSALKDHLQSFIEGQLNAEENKASF
jgi:hypothetical protein